MNLMANEPHSQMDPIHQTLLHAVDMEVASRSSLPVLISAPKESALAMAIEIAVGPAARSAHDVVVVDGADSRYLQATMARAASAALDAPRAMVVHDVDAMDHAQQSALMALTCDIAERRAPACRIIATTSVPLFDRVVQGSFDAGLFYRLNNIHIKVGGFLA
jgi:hypothetical protein